MDEIEVYSLGQEERADFHRAYLRFVFQSFHLVPYLTIIGNVILPLTPTPLKQKEKLAKAKQPIKRGDSLKTPCGEERGGNMKKGIFAFLAVLFIGVAAFIPLAKAQQGHGGGAKHEGMKMDTREVLVEGMKITFAIMANKEHKKMLEGVKMKEEPEPGTTHNISVTLKDHKGKEVTDAQISMKVIDPQGKDQGKPLKYEPMMNSFDAYFNLSGKGKYQILVLVKTRGQKRTAGIYYELK